MTKQRGFAPILLLLLAAVGVLAIIFATNTFNYRDSIFSKLFPKPSSHAVGIGELDGTVFLHYFAWYSSSPNYFHWLGLKGADGLPHNIAPDDIATPFYPKLGTYSTDDINVINQQLEWIKLSKTDVIIYDWWGRGSEEDKRLGVFMDRVDTFNKAKGASLKVAIMIDDYPGRTAETVESDIKYLIDAHGNKPVFYRVNRPTKYGNNLKNSPRPMFYVWSSIGDAGNWPDAMDRIHNSPYDSIVLVNGNDNNMAFATGSNNCTDGAGINSIGYDSETAHSDGAFAWSAAYTDHCYTKQSSLPAKSADYIAIYSVNPGYDDFRNREKPYNSISRQDGAYYYNQWEQVTSQKVEAVAISTFNEWLEGTQIEPAVPKSYNNSTSSFTYYDYQGDFNTNLTGAEQGLEYIYATSYLADKYKKSQAPIESETDSTRTVFAHYYAWYSALPTWLHWNSCSGCKAPDNIYTKYYPTLGAYDSSSDSVIDAHMKWLKFAKVDVALLSYWGVNHEYSTDLAVRKVLDKAAANGLKVAFMLEPGPVEKHRESITHIITNLTNNATHPGLFKVIRKTKYGTNPNPRPLFTFYNWGQHYGNNNPEMTADQIKAAYRELFDSLRNTPLDGIFLTENSRAAMVLNPAKTPQDASARNDVDNFHNDGLFNYSADAIWTGQTFAQSSDYLNLIQVAPGFDNTKIGGTKVVDRKNGAYYDESWKEVATQKPEWVVILTFNELGENSQIEPMKSSGFPTTYNYSSYVGHFPGMDCVNDDARYLCATAKWADQYKGIISTPLPTPTVVPSPLPSATASPKPSATATPTAKPTLTPTPAPTKTPTPSATATPTSTPPTPTPSPTGDIESPSAPTNLQSNVVSSSQINLSWTPSTDNIGVSAYEVYRNNALVATVSASTLSYGDANLLAATKYTYYLKARDAANNISSASITTSVTTQPIPTPAPKILGSIIGKVTSTTGSPIYGAKVGMTINGIRYTYTTKSSGVYSISNVPANSYQLRYSARGYYSTNVNTSLVEGQILTKDVSLRKR